MASKKGKGGQSISKVNRKLLRQEKTELKRKVKATTDVREQKRLVKEFGDRWELDDRDQIEALERFAGVKTEQTSTLKELTKSIRQGAKSTFEAAGSRLPLGNLLLNQADKTGALIGALQAANPLIGGPIAMIYEAKKRAQERNKRAEMERQQAAAEEERERERAAKKLAMEQAKQARQQEKDEKAYDKYWDNKARERAKEEEKFNKEEMKRYQTRLREMDRDQKQREREEAKRQKEAEKQRQKNQKEFEKAQRKMPREQEPSAEPVRQPTNQVPAPMDDDFGEDVGEDMGDMSESLSDIDEEMKEFNEGVGSSVERLVTGFEEWGEDIGQDSGSLLVELEHTNFILRGVEQAIGEIKGILIDMKRNGIPVQGMRAYATGGIATQPQVALHGEGSTPEAYVPLPDGKTIPVTLEKPQGSGMGESCCEQIRRSIEKQTETLVQQMNKDARAQMESFKESIAEQTKDEKDQVERQEATNIKLAEAAREEAMHKDKQHSELISAIKGIQGLGGMKEPSGLSKALEFFDALPGIMKFFGMLKSGLGMLFSFGKTLWSIFGGLMKFGKLLLRFAGPLAFIFTAFEVFKTAIEGFQENGILGGISGIFEGLVNAVTDIGSLITGAVDMLFGTSLTDSLTGFQKWAVEGIRKAFGIGGGDTAPAPSTKAPQQATQTAPQRVGANTAPMTAPAAQGTRMTALQDEVAQAQTAPPPVNNVTTVNNNQSVATGGGNAKEPPGSPRNADSTLGMLNRQAFAGY